MRVTVAKVNEVFFDGEAHSLTLPGIGGELTILGEHMPLVTLLKAGTVTIRGEEDRHIKIDGGVLEVRPDGATVIL